MVEPYNLTAISRSDTLVELVQNSNTLSGNLIGVLTVITVFIISFVWFKSGFDGKTSFAGSSFITALISIFLRVLGLISDRVMFGVFIIAGLSYVVMRWSS